MANSNHLSTNILSEAGSSLGSAVRTTLLAVAAILSALLVVWSTHQCRELMAELMSLQAQENTLHVEYGQYLLQEGALSSPARLEQLARERLGMSIPLTSDIRVIRP